MALGLLGVLEAGAPAAGLLLGACLVLGCLKRLLGGGELALHPVELGQRVGVGALNGVEVLVGREEVSEAVRGEQQAYEPRGSLLHLVQRAQRLLGALALLGELGVDLVDLCLRLVDLCLELAHLGAGIAVGLRCRVDPVLELVGRCGVGAGGRERA